MKDKMPALLSVLVVTVFLVEFVFGVCGPFKDRFGLMFEAAAKMFVVVFGLMVIAVRYMRCRKLSLVPSAHGGVIVVLLLWVMSSILAALMGVLVGHDLNYVVGDAYKFLMLPILFCLCYFGIDTEEDVDFILDGLVVIYTVFITYYLILYFSAQLPKYTLTPVAQNIPLVMPVLLYVLYSKKQRAMKQIALFAVVQIPFLAYFTQSLGLVFNIIFITTLFLMLKHRVSFRKVLIIMGIVVACAGIFLHQFMWGDAFSSVREHVLKQHSSQEHLIYKAQTLLNAKESSLVQKSELLTGGRISQFVDLFKYFSDYPQQIWFGSGMGGIFMKNASIVFRKSWIGPGHFMESAFGEVLFRTGFCGFFLFVTFILIFLKKVVLYFQKDRTSVFGILVVVFGVQLFVNYIMTSPLSQPYLILCILFAGVLLVEKGQQNKLSQMRT